MSDSPINREYLRHIATTTLIGASFGLVWGLFGSAAVPGLAQDVLTVLDILITVILFGLAFTFMRAARRIPTANASTTNPFGTRIYSLVVVAEFIAIGVASRLLTESGHPAAVISVIAVIVGLHFFGLIPAFHVLRFAAVGGMMILLGVGSLFLPPSIITGSITLELRTAVVGLGCALILWVWMLPMVVNTRRQLHQPSD